MRLYDLAVRLAAVEVKLSTLTGTVPDTDIIDDVAEFDQRLSVVEVQVDQLIINLCNTTMQECWHILATQEIWWYHFKW